MKTKILRTSLDDIRMQTPAGLLKEYKTIMPASSCTEGGSANGGGGGGGGYTLPPKIS